MSDAPGAEGGHADPQSHPPAGHLVGEPEPIDSACPSSQAALGGYRHNQAETPVPGGGGGCCTRSSGRLLMVKGDDRGDPSLHTSGEYLETCTHTCEQEREIWGPPEKGRSKA